MSQSAAFLAAAAIALGHALQLANGFYDPSALRWLTLALACAVIGAVGPRIEGDWRRVVITLLIAGIGWQLLQLLTASPGFYLETANLGPFRIGVAVEAALVAGGLLPLRRLRAWWFPLLAAVHVALGCWLIRASPAPQIDVVTVTNAAWEALRHGTNPYAITFPDIYGAGSAFYSPGSVVDGRVQFGYPYPPVSLLLVIPGYAFGDYRYALLAAIVGSALLMAYARPSHHAQLAGVLFLTTPRVFFVLEQGWSEPASLVLISLTVYAMVRRPGAIATAAGAAIASKQYLVAAVPLLWGYLRRNSREPWRLLIAAGVAAAVVTAPFFLWSPRAFTTDVVLLQLREPFRLDALSYLSWMAGKGWGEPSFAWTAGAMLAAIAIVAGRRDGTPSAFAASLAFVMLATFAFGRKAFCNYYFFVVGLLCCAVAASDMLAKIKRSTDEPAFRPRP